MRRPGCQHHSHHRRKEVTIKRNTQVDLERPTLSAIRKRLPSDRRHLFLRLMPYSYDAPYDYGTLQTVAFHALGADDAARCVEALEQLATLYDHGLGELPARNDLLVEIAHRVRRRHASYLAAELEFATQLAVDNITLDEFKVQGETAGVPMLVGNVRWIAGKPTTIGRAMQPLDEAVVSLTGRPAHELMELPVRERMAAIRIVRMYCVFGAPTGRGPVEEARRNFFCQLGRPVWRILGSPGFGEQPADPGMYGEPAMRRIELALELDRANAHPPYSVEPGEEPIASDAAQWMPPNNRPSNLHLVVKDQFAAGRDADDKALLKQFEPLRQPMPVAQMPTTAELDQKLGLMAAEFPWAEGALQTLFNDLHARSAFGSVRLGFHPILLRGPAGCGKSRLAQRLAEVLGVASLTMSLAGATDAMGILGTARGWSSGQPSPLLRPLLKGSATVLLCFDELDKAANRTSNSPPVESALLSLLEPEEAKRWRDPFLQVACDLSTLLFVFTCNSTAHLPGPLLSRLRILDIERPQPAHFAQVVPYVLKDLETEWGLPTGALQGIPVERELLRDLSSMREVRRAVSTVVRLWMREMGGAIKH